MYTCRGKNNGSSTNFIPNLLLGRYNNILLGKFKILSMIDCILIHETWGTTK